MSGPVDPMFYVWTMIPAAIILPIAMLPSIKGAVIGLQWAHFMYGFLSLPTGMVMPRAGQSSMPTACTAA